MANNHKYDNEGFFRLSKVIYNSKKAYSVGFSWVFGLVSLFGIGVMYIVFSQVFKAHLVPIVKDMTNVSTIDPATVSAVFSGVDKYMMFFDILPFVLFFVVVLYMIVVAIRKEREDVY